jgi:hypothetical protein
MTSIARIERFVVQSMLGLVTPSFNAVSFFMSPGGVLHLFVALSELAPHDQAAIDDIVGYLDASLQPPMPMEVHTWVGDWDFPLAAGDAAGSDEPLRSPGPTREITIPLGRSVTTGGGERGISGMSTGAAGARRGSSLPWANWAKRAVTSAIFRFLPGGVG